MDDHRRPLVFVALLALGVIACTCFAGNWLPFGREVTSTWATAESLRATSMALATQVAGNEILATARAFATQQGPGLFETAQAFATQDLGNWIATAQAIATQGAVPFSEAPPDIPIIEGEKTRYFASRTMLSYETAIDFSQVVTFYKEQMFANGWTKLDQSWIETADNAMLNYQKNDRQALVAIGRAAESGRTVVVITIIE